MTQLSRIEQKLDYLIEHHGIKPEIEEHLHDDDLLHYIKTRISYSPETGEMVWIKGHQRDKAVGRAELAQDGYRLASVRQKDYSLAQLAWFIGKGELLNRLFAPINGDFEDLRLENITIDC